MVDFPEGKKLLECLSTSLTIWEYFGGKRIMSYGQHQQQGKRPFVYYRMSAMGNELGNNSGETN